MNFINYKNIEKLIFTIALCVVFCVIIFFLSLKAYASPKIVNVIVVSYKGSKVVLYFKVNNAFNQSFKKAILSGFPVKFRFHIKVLGIPSMKVLYRKIIANTIVYDDLNNYFIINYNYNSKSSEKIIEKNFNKALKLMSRVNDMSIDIPNDFKINNRYIIIIKGVLGNLKLPFPLRYIPFIGNYFQITTNTFKLEFVY